MSVFTKIALSIPVVIVAMVFVEQFLSVQGVELMLRMFGTGYLFIVTYYCTIDKGRSWWLGNTAKYWFFGVYLAACAAMAWSIYGV